MVSKDILWAKMSALRKHLERIRIKRTLSVDEFFNDLDRQESILFNLQMAVQNCIDMAAHIVSEQELGAVGSTSELFYLLEEQGIIEYNLTMKMVQATGFRNLIVHDYGKVDLEMVFRVSHHHLDNLEEFAGIISKRFG